MSNEVELDILIGISEEQSKSQPKLWDATEQDQEIAKLVETHQLRLQQSTSEDVKQASILELAQIAQTHPHRVSNLQDSIIKIIALTINTKASNAGFRFLNNLLFSDSLQDQRSQCLQQLFQIDGFLNLTLESARLFITTQQQYPNTTNEALQFIYQLLTHETTKDQIISLFQFSQKSLFYNQNYQLNNFAIHCIFAKQENCFEIIRKMLQNNFVNFVPVENQQFIQMPLNESLIQAQVISQIFAFLQQYKASSDYSFQALQFLSDLLKGEYGQKQLFYNQLLQYKQLLHDLFHAVAYNFIQNKSQQNILSILFNILIAFLEDNEDFVQKNLLKEFYGESKILDFTAILICGVSDDFFDQNIEIFQKAQKLLIAIIQQKQNLQLKLAVTVINIQENKIIHFATKISQISIRKPEFFQLVNALFCENEEMGIAFTASLSKPLRAARKGTFVDGFKLLLQAFSIAPPKTFTAQAQDQFFNKYAETCCYLAKFDIDKELEKPLCDIPLQAAQIFLTELFDGNMFQKASEILYQIVLKNKNSALHFISACLNDEQLKNVNNSQQYSVENICCAMFKKVAQCEVERQQQILKVLAAAFVSLDNEKPYYHLVSGFCKAQINFEQIIEILANIAKKRDNSTSAIFAAIILAHFPSKLQQLLFKFILKKDLQQILNLKNEDLDEKFYEHQSKLIAKLNEADSQQQTVPLQNTVSFEEYNQLKAQYEAALGEIQRLKQQIASSCLTAVDPPSIDIPVQEQTQNVVTNTRNNRRKMISINNEQEPQIAEPELQPEPLQNEENQLL